MDRARDFHFVKQLPRRTTAQVDYSDVVYDRQVLLNETWQHYCMRCGYDPERATEDRVKWVTETWEEYEDRVPCRAEALGKYSVQAQRAADEAAAEEAARRAAAERIIMKMAKNDVWAASERLPTIHTLYIDFELERTKRHAAERAELEEQEIAARLLVQKLAEDARIEIEVLAAQSLQKALELLELRRKKKEEEENRVREEQRRKAEERKRAEEERKHAAEEAERKRREAEEEAKRAERRRKDEERKAKARAEREARTKSHKSIDPVVSSRQTRVNRMSADMQMYLEKLRSDAEAIDNEDAMMKLWERVASTDLAGNILFHTAIYLGVLVSPPLEPAVIQYKYASPNCSPKLLSLKAELHQDDGDANPKTIAMCVQQSQSTGIIRNWQDLKMIGDWPTDNTTAGDFIAAPILGADQHTVAVLAADTLNVNAQDDPASLQHGEDGVYPKDGSPCPAVQMPDAEGAFIEDVAKILSALAAKVDEKKKAGQQHPEAEPVKKPGGLHHVDIPDVSSIPELFNFFTRTVHNEFGLGPTVSAYVSRLHRPNGAACTVVSHNGIALNDPHRHTQDVPCHLLGLTLTEPKAPTFSAFCPPSHADSTFKRPNHLFVEDVSSCDRCQSYTKQAKPQECLLLVPLVDARDRCIAIVGVSCETPPSLSAEQIEQIIALVHGIQKRLLPLLRKQYLSQICTQAIDWLSITTASPNIYIALQTNVLSAALNDPDKQPEHQLPLEIIAATQNQQWLVGKKWSESDKIGVSHRLLKASGPNVPQLLHVPKISDYADADGARVHLWDEAKKSSDGSLVAGTIAAQSAVLGIVYCDTVGADSGCKSGGFTKSDLEIVKTTAQLLGEVLSDTQPTDAEYAVLAKRILAIEELVGADEIQFLKRVWIKVTSDIQRITKDQLLELSRYNSPPPIIPVTLSATFIAMGTKPSVVEKWEDTRKKIKLPMLGRIVAQDPTGTKVRNAFFIRARRMTKPYTADDVFTKGSYPASCFFTWTYVTLLLHRASKILRRKRDAGEFDHSGRTDAALTDATNETEDTAEMATGDEAEAEAADMADVEEAEAEDVTNAQDPDVETS